MRKVSKRGQLTIFVIIAIVLVGLIAGFFILKNKDGTISISPVENPRGYIEDCMKKAGEEAINKIVPLGGLVNPKKAYFFNETNVTMMCYAIEYEKLCVNQHPMLSKEIENQIVSLAKSKIDGCFAKLKSSLANYDYKEVAGELEVQIQPERVLISSNKKITYTKDQTVSLDGFNSAVKSSLWDFVIIENKILNQELSCECGEESCNADVVKLSLENPEFELEHFIAGKGEEVYSIREIETGKIFNLALRNCVIKPYGVQGGTIL